MALVKVPARDWDVEVENAAGDTWITVAGLQTITFGGEAEQLDTTDMDSGGWAENIIIQRARSVSLEGDWLEDTADGSRDSGQDRVDSLRDEMGQSSKGKFRLTSPGGNVRTFNGTVTMADVGGGRNAKTSWGATINVSGTITVT